MRQEQTLSPSVWLASGPIVMPRPGAVLDALVGGTARVVRFVGPHRLYRAAGWHAAGDRAASTAMASASFASAFGSWWADEAALARLGERLLQSPGVLPPSLLQRAGPAHLRAAAALCDDTQPLRHLLVLDLPAREELTGVVGLAAPQPRCTAQDVSPRDARQLPGGIEQAFFKRTQALNAVKPQWVRICPW